MTLTQVVLDSFRKEVQSTNGGVSKTYDSDVNFLIDRLPQSIRKMISLEMQLSRKIGLVSQSDSLIKGVFNYYDEYSF